MRFLQQFDNILVYVLLAAGFVKLMLGLWLDASIITGVVIINALLGFLQEGKAEKALEFDPQHAVGRRARAARRRKPHRAGRGSRARRHRPARIRRPHSRRPAAGRRQESAHRRSGADRRIRARPTSRPSRFPKIRRSATAKTSPFRGRSSFRGARPGVVVATGAQTELGRINQMLASVDALETPLLRQIEEFGHTIAKVIGFVSVAVFAYGRWVRDLSFVEAFQAVVGIAVSVIPEGLPALITITLAIGVQRMAKRNAIIRRLPAVETLGSVSRICSDKTGTLTLMEMMVASAVTAQSAYRVTGDGYAEEGAGSARRRASPRRRDPERHGNGFGAVQRLRAAAGRRRLEGRGRPHRGGALSLRDETRPRSRERARGPSPHRRHPLRVRTQIHGDAA